MLCQESQQLPHLSDPSCRALPIKCRLPVGQQKKGCLCLETSDDIITYVLNLLCTAFYFPRFAMVLASSRWFYTNLPSFFFSSLSPWGYRSSCVVPFPGDGHTCDLQVVHLAAEPGTPGQAEIEPPGFTFWVWVCVCVHDSVCVCNRFGGFLKGSIKAEGR